MSETFIVSISFVVWIIISCYVLWLAELNPSVRRRHFGKIMKKIKTYTEKLRFSK